MIYFLRVSTRTTHINTVCPRSGHTFYKVTYHIKLVTTSWTHNSQKVKLLNITKYIIYLIKNFQWIFRHKVIFVDFMRNKKYWLCISLTKELRQKNCDLKPSKHISLIIILIYTLYNYWWRCSTFLLTKSSHWTKKLIIRHFTGCPNVSINKKKALLVEKFQSTKNAQKKIYVNVWTFFDFAKCINSSIVEVLSSKFICFMSKWRVLRPISD